MAPQDQHSVVMGFDGVETSTPDLSKLCVDPIIYSNKGTLVASPWVICRPYRDSNHNPCRPTAEAVGYVLSPLRGCFNRELVQRRGPRAESKLSTLGKSWSPSYENDVPQPHDFLAFGLRNSKPWCIRLSS